MIGLCGRELTSDALPSPIAGPIGDWLCDTNAGRFAPLAAAFNQEAVDFDLHLLQRGLAAFPANSLGAKLDELVSARIKQRPL